MSEVLCGSAPVVCSRPAGAEVFTGLLFYNILVLVVESLRLESVEILCLIFFLVLGQSCCLDQGRVRN